MKSIRSSPNNHKYKVNNKIFFKVKENHIDQEIRKHKFGENFKISSKIFQSFSCFFVLSLLQSKQTKVLIHRTCGDKRTNVGFACLECAKSNRLVQALWNSMMKRTFLNLMQNSLSRQLLITRACNERQLCYNVSSATLCNKNKSFFKKVLTLLHWILHRMPCKSAFGWAKWGLG